MFLLIKSIFGDIISLYKNFGHWMLSKIFISVSRYAITILFLLPFLFVLILVVWISPYSFLEYQKIIQDILIALYPLGNNFLGFSIWTLIISILFILMVLGGMIAMFYNRILLAKLHIKYIDGKKLKYKKNLYFNRKMFFKYLSLSVVCILILLTPFILFLFGFLVLFFIFGGTSEINMMMGNQGSLNIFSIGNFILFIVCLLLFIYLLFRLFSSYFIIVEYNKKTIKHSIKKSFKITKGYQKFLKFIGLMLMLFIAYMPLNYISQVIDFNAKSISFYMGMKEYVGKGNAQEKLNQEEFYGFMQLQQRYGKISDKELVGKVRFMNIMSWLYFIFHFVFLYGIFDMVLVGFYKRELLKK